MRIRPPELEIRICDAKYHVSLPPPPPSAAAASPEIRSGQLDEENPSAQILSGLLVQADEGIRNPVSVDWAVKMRIRPPELETSICDAKYHVSLAQNLKNFKIDQIRPDIEYRPKKFMGCPGQAQTKRRRKNQPSQQSAGNHVGRAASAITLSAPSAAGRATKLRDGRASPRDVWRTAAPIAAHSRALLFDHRATISVRPGDIDARPSRGCARYPSKFQNRRPSSQTSRTAVAHRRAFAAPPPSVRSVIGLVSITATRSFRPCQNPSDLLVQIDGGILIPVMDLIDDLPPPTV
ncbi:hypothetical protein F511_42502 [Dorcoceras hygrometricum]|uniref:Uncharacterized protein n=1 Tax=Dorcoceras hygrometricum TaxID=472368 RepID=A0A2Z7BU58_9LAMI|nr:hypothetical protein F511_42502 [Dorcoceras hygrometricum]